MQLFIAEKPSLARAIAQGIGKGDRKNGYIELDGGNTIVTWCFGHILEQYNPDEYDEKYKHWNMADLPIIPEHWKLKVRKDAKDQFKVIKELASKADSIVNAGDPDREGQLLIDEVLDYIGNKKPVLRILLNALDDKSVKEALHDLRHNGDFLGLKNSALARSRADWLVGMNLSRAYTINAQAAGYQGVLNVGRVLTPTMALVVRREQEIMNFKPVTHYQGKVIFHHEHGDIPATWKMPQDMDGLDNEGHLLDKSVVEGMFAKIDGQAGKIESVAKQQKKSEQRLPYSLSALQIDAGRRYGYTPQQVLDTMQTLYEKKYTTYPRSDCDFLPENQLADAKQVLQSISCITKDGFADLISRADTSIRSRCWNDTKISAHHAIIPTVEKPNFDALTPIEQNLYTMVAQAYLAQFFPVHTFMSTKLTISCGGETFTATGKNILNNGWKDIYKGIKTDDEDKKEEPVLPEVAEGDGVTPKDTAVVEKITKPPTRFNPSTLLKAMKEIYKYVKDPALKAELKECSGIGTEATRAGIIEKLQNYGFFELKKKYLVPTEKAEMAVKALPEEITYPDTTAVWEKELEEVSSGKLSLDEFSIRQEKKLQDFLGRAKAVKIEAAADVPKCPICGKALRRRKGKTGFFWGCTGYPECKTTFPDKGGKPDFKAKRSSASGLTATCPSCGKKLRQIKGKYGTFWGCEDRDNCGATFPDHADKPVIVKCPTCKKHYLKRLESRKKKGSFFWVCSDRNCKGGIISDKNGLPDV